MWTCCDIKLIAALLLLLLLLLLLDLVTSFFASLAPVFFTITSTIFMEPPPLLELLLLLTPLPIGAGLRSTLITGRSPPFSIANVDAEGIVIAAVSGVFLPDESDAWRSLLPKPKAPPSVDLNDLDDVRLAGEDNKLVSLSFPLSRVTPSSIAAFLLARSMSAGSVDLIAEPRTKDGSGLAFADVDRLLIEGEAARLIGCCSVMLLALGLT